MFGVCVTWSGLCLSINLENVMWMKTATTTTAAAKVNNFNEAIYSVIFIFVVAIAFIIIIINSLCVFHAKAGRSLLYTHFAEQKKWPIKKQYEQLIYSAASESARHTSPDTEKLLLLNIVFDA